MNISIQSGKLISKMFIVTFFIVTISFDLDAMEYYANTQNDDQISNQIIKGEVDAINCTNTYKLMESIITLSKKKYLPKTSGYILNLAMEKTGQSLDIRNCGTGSTIFHLALLESPIMKDPNISRIDIVNMILAALEQSENVDLIFTKDSHDRTPFFLLIERYSDSPSTEIFKSVLDTVDKFIPKNIRSEKFYDLFFIETKFGKTAYDCASVGIRWLMNEYLNNDDIVKIYNQKLKTTDDKVLKQTPLKSDRKKRCPCSCVLF